MHCDHRQGEAARFPERYQSCIDIAGEEMRVEVSRQLQNDGGLQFRRPCSHHSQPSVKLQCEYRLTLGRHSRRDVRPLASSKFGLTGRREKETFSRAMEQDDEERVDVAPVGHRRGGGTPQGQMGGEYGEEMGRLADMLEGRGCFCGGVNFPFVNLPVDAGGGSSRTADPNHSERLSPSPGDGATSRSSAAHRAAHLSSSLIPPEQIVERVEEATLWLWFGTVKTLITDLGPDANPGPLNESAVPPSTTRGRAVGREYSPTGEGVLSLLDGCWICSLCGDGGGGGGGSGGRELMIDGNRKGYTPAGDCCGARRGWRSSSQRRAKKGALSTGRAEAWRGRAAIG
ncbi:hypothetical protein EYF80_038652 [Liparis tanakae]|uniref:Uncharacterized protein n=1 Tax=Liparis tanakae TaxID=230148 RepID=A0A4Z2GD41_9TELE|nr:hypothetical protein EYF80_038652 [Liparis tanakae]